MGMNMEKTRFEKRFSHNKFTPGCFAKLSVAFEIIVVFLYGDTLQRFLFTEIN